MEISMEEKIEKVEENKIYIPIELPIILLKGEVLFPKMVMDLWIGHPKSLKIIADSLVSNKVIGIIPTKDPQAKEPKPENISSIGTASLLLRIYNGIDGTIIARFQGLSRIKPIKVLCEDPYIKAEIEIISEEVIKDAEIDAHILNIRNLFQKAIEFYLFGELDLMKLNIENPDSLVAFIIPKLDISINEKQEILETLNVKRRLRDLKDKLFRFGTKIVSDSNT